MVFQKGSTLGDFMDISCIIPAYNEEKRIGNVIKVVQSHPLVREVIVINDGSSDKTEDVMRKFKGIKLISYKKNCGKSYAIMKGIEAAKSDLLLFIDADLIGLNKKNITDLIDPVLKGKSDMSISLRINAPWFYRKIGIDFISGERVINRNLFPDLKRLANLKFGIEVFMNNEIIKRKLRIGIVRLDNVISPYPNKKYGFFKGTKRFIGMILQIFKTAGIFGTIYQVYMMHTLTVKL